MTDRYARSAAAPNLFFACDSRRFLFLAIAKNACTTLKHLCYELDAGQPFECADPDAIHDHLGYAPVRGRIIDRRDRAQLAALSGYTRFAVYRDPIERLLSAYADKTQPAGPAHPFFFEHGLVGMPLDPFLDVLKEILAQPDPLRIDEHLRPQHLCFDPDDVDFVVPIEHLARFLDEQFGVAPRRFNTSRTRVAPSRDQRDRIRALYLHDYEIVPSYPS